MIQHIYIFNKMDYYLNSVIQILKNKKLIFDFYQIEIYEKIKVNNLKNFT